jgi:WD40 repeat protein
MPTEMKDDAGQIARPPLLMLREWARFFRSQAHILNRDPQLLLQQAINRPDPDPIAESARFHLQRLPASRPWVKWINKPQRLDPCILVLNAKPARHCCFTPRGRHILTWGASDKTALGLISLWDAETGRLVYLWEEARVGEPIFVALRDGRWGIPVQSGKSLDLWDAESAVYLRPLVSVPDNVACFSVSPDACTIVFGHNDGRVRIFKTESGSEPFSMPLHANAVESCRFVLQGRRVLTRDKTRVRLFDASSGRILLEKPDDGWEYGRFYISLDERRFLLEERNEARGVGWTTLWEVETGRSWLQVTGDRHPIEPCGISPDGSRVLALEFDLGEITQRVVEIWSVAENRREAFFPLGWKWPWHPVRISPDGRLVAAGRFEPDAPGELKVWDSRSGEAIPRAHFEGHSSFLCDVTFSPDGRSVASIDNDGELRLWEVPEGSTPAGTTQSQQHPNAVAACAFSPDGSQVVSCCVESRMFHHENDHSSSAELRKVSAAELRFWQTDSGELRAAREAGQSKPSHCAFAPDGRHLAVSSHRLSGEDIQIWDLELFTVCAKLSGHTSGVGGCTYTPDGRRLVSMGFSVFRGKPEDNALKIWDPATGFEIATLVGHSGEMNTFTLSPDGRFAMADSSILQREVSGPEANADPDGDLLTALSGPRIPADLFVWDLENASKAFSLPGHWGCAFSPDGRLAALISTKGAAALWKFTDGASALRELGSTDVRTCTFTPDGRELLLDLKNGSRVFVNPATGKQSRLIRFPGDVLKQGSFTPDGRYLIINTGTALRVINACTCEQVAAFPAATRFTKAVVGKGGRLLATGDGLGRVGLLSLIGIDLGPQIATAVRLWKFGSFGAWRRWLSIRPRGQKDDDPIARCQNCGVTMGVPQAVLDTIGGIAREAGLPEDASPCLELPREAWEEKRLVTSCSRCGTPLRFSPFVA